MVFSNLVFMFVFLPLFFICYFAFKSRKIRNYVLLAFSLVFYGWGEPLYIFLMLFSIWFNYEMAIKIERKKRHDIDPKGTLVFDVVVNLLLIGIYKYADFAIGIINVIPGVNIPPANIPLPIGISFYTFQIVSYVIDVYRGDVRAQRKISYLGAYLCAFPQLIAGPIVRYSTVAHELEHRVETIDDFAYGARRFVAGLGKKVLIANNMAMVADSIFARGGSEYGFIGGWIGILAYTMQIYFDFSGYSDMAIGMGRMMGFHFLENFDYPYISKSVTEFWRRWHMSLSSFFRDYVYIPLGGNRVSSKRLILNILIVWMLTGLWHGAAWNFILWGVYYGLLLLAEKFIFGKALKKMPSAIQHIYTIFVFIIGWVLFRAESMVQLVEILGSMFGAYGKGSVGFLVFTQVLTVKNILAGIGAIIFSMPVAVILKRKLDKTKLGAFVVDLSVVIILIACVLMLEIGSYNPFIYFRF
ncbi:MAG: MBOAT family protein [Eubacteriales bacterium]|nr:MBOAT family protein [Eubacteriales bacterium]